MAQKISDKRSNSNTDPVFRTRLSQFVFASTEAVVKQVLANGAVRVVAGITTATNAITYTTTIADEDGIVLYTKTDWAQAATEVDTLTADTEVFVPAGSTVTITPSGDVGDGTFDIILIGK